jgi:hypothetical protein
MWIDTITGEVAQTHSDVRALRPNWSAPLVLTDEMVLDAGFDPVVLSPPGHDPITHKATELPPELKFGKWTQVWLIQALPEIEVMANRIAAFDTTRTILRDFVQDILDTTAKVRGYDGILSAASYATSLNPKFRAEAQACVEFRDKMWSECYRLEAEVVDGLRSVPTPQELRALLPVIAWPVA